jgi:hypothetical protein
MHWSEVPNGAMPVVVQRDIRSAGIKKTGEGRVVLVSGVANLDGSDLLVVVPDDSIHGDLLALNEDQAKAIFRGLLTAMRSWGYEEGREDFEIGYEQALIDAANAIQSPEKRNEVGGGLGWETGVQVVDKMIQDVRKARD